MFRIQVDKTQQTIIEKEITTSGSANVYDIEFTFSPDWDGFQKTAVFLGVSINQDNEETLTEPYGTSLDESNRCKVPWELMQNVGDKIRVGVFGMKGLDSILPTNIVEITTISQGIYNGEVIPSDPTPSAYQDILNRLNDLYDAISAGMLKGDRGERGYKGEKGDRGERGYKGDQGEQGPPGVVDASSVIDVIDFEMSNNAHTVWDSKENTLTVHLNSVAEGSRLYISSEIECLQEGEGTPSLDNIRNIIGMDSITLSFNGEDITKEFSESVYKGHYDWSKGELTITHKIIELSVEDFNNYPYPGWKDVVGLNECFDGGFNGYHTPFKMNFGTKVTVNTTGNNETISLSSSLFNLSFDEWKNQYPDLKCQFVFHLVEPRTIKMDSMRLVAISGENNISSNSGKTHVDFQVDLKKYIDDKIASIS